MKRPPNGRGNIGRYGETISKRGQTCLFNRAGKMVSLSRSRVSPLPRRGAMRGACDAMIREDISSPRAIAAILRSHALRGLPRKITADWVRDEPENVWARYWYDFIRAHQYYFFLSNRNFG